MSSARYCCSISTKRRFFSMFTSVPTPNFTKIRPVGAKLIMRTDGHGEANRCFSRVTRTHLKRNWTWPSTRTTVYRYKVVSQQIAARQYRASSYWPTGTQVHKCLLNGATTNYVTVLNCLDRQVPSSIMKTKTSYPDREFSGFSQSLQPKAMIVSQIR
jgi:hypothetical protein